jgi:hypothetical protein
MNLAVNYWFHSVFVALPLWLVLTLSPYLNPSRLKALLLGGLLVSIGTLPTASGLMFLTERLAKREILNAPFPTFWEMSPRPGSTLATGIVWSWAVACSTAVAPPLPGPRAKAKDLMAEPFPD